MGCDCTTYFPKGTKASDVEEFLVLLGFEKVAKPFVGRTGLSAYHYFKDDNYRYITGLYAELSRDEDNPGQLRLWTRTSIWRSKFDSDFHNYTLKQLRKRFGGFFESDYGRNRYFRFDGPVREKAEAGANQAYRRFINNIQRAEICAKSEALIGEGKHKIHGDDVLDSLNPRIISANVLVPFLVSTIEDYFRSLYVALLRYSPVRERVIQNARLQGMEVVAIDKGDLTVPEAIAKWMNFQDMSKINSAFKDLNNKYDIHGVLNRPYGRRRERPWGTLNRLISQRHELIHSAELQTDYLPSKLQADIDLVRMSLWRIYEDLIRQHKWHPVGRRGL